MFRLAMRARGRAIAAEKRDMRWLAWQVGRLSALAQHAPKKFPRFDAFVGKEGVEASAVRPVQPWQNMLSAAMAWDARIKAQDRVKAKASRAANAGKRRGVVREAKAVAPAPG